MVGVSWVIVLEGEGAIVSLSPTGDDRIYDPVKLILSVLMSSEPPDGTDDSFRLFPFLVSSSFTLVYDSVLIKKKINSVNLSGEISAVFTVPAIIFRIPVQAVRKTIGATRVYNTRWFVFCFSHTIRYTSFFVYGKNLVELILNLVKG